jgi:hypothetical protein
MQMFLTQQHITAMMPRLETFILALEIARLPETELPFTRIPVGLKATDEQYIRFHRSLYATLKMEVTNKKVWVYHFLQREDVPKQLNRSKKKGITKRILGGSYNLLKFP